jgi:hypothetical protein
MFNLFCPLSSVTQILGRLMVWMATTKYLDNRLDGAEGMERGVQFKLKG